MTAGMILAKGFYWLCILVGGSIAMAVAGLIGLILIITVGEFIKGEDYDR